MATASQLVLDAYGPGPLRDDGGESTVRMRLVRARSEFYVKTAAINAEIRDLLTPDQVDLLPDQLTMMLNPRFWRLISLEDAGDF